MSLQWELPREVPADTAQIGQAILKADNLYRQLGDRFAELLPKESVFTELYEPTGRGAVSPLLLALVTVFQMLEKAPDRLAADWVVSRLDWKYALHLPLTYTGFHFTDLSAFRQRLLAHAQEALVFDHLLARLKDLGMVPRQGKVRTDSTHVLGVVERLSRLELVTESVRLALGAVRQLAPEWVAEKVPAAFQETYAQRTSEYGLSQSQVREKLAQVGQDGVWFLAQLDASGPFWTRQLPEVETLRTVLAQQFGPSDEPPKGPRGSGEERISSPHEPEARYSQKRGKDWIGYKVHVTETCDEQLPHLIVDLTPTNAARHDNPELPCIQARLAEWGVVPSEQYVDQGYMSGERIHDSQHRGIDLIGPPPQDTVGAEGYRQADFQIDLDAQQAVCPEGQRAPFWSPAATPTAPIRIRFDAERCRTCPAFGGGCTTAVRGRQLEVHAYHAALAQRRAEMHTQTYRIQLKRRAGIEGTISELVRGHGLRRARYRGLAKLKLQCFFTAVATNLKRLIRWWTSHSTPSPVDHSAARPLAAASTPCVSLFAC